MTPRPSKSAWSNLDYVVADTPTPTHTHTPNPNLTTPRPQRTHRQRRPPRCHELGTIPHTRPSRQTNPTSVKLPSSRGAGNMSYFFATPVDIDVVLEDADERAMVDVKLDKNRREKAPLYMDGESVKGAVTVRPKDGKRLEHTGVKVQFIGTIGAPPCRCPDGTHELIPQVLTC